MALRLHIPSFGALQRLPIAASLPFTNQATEAQGGDVKQRPWCGSWGGGSSDTDLVGVLNESSVACLSSRPHNRAAEPWTSPTDKLPLLASGSRGPS